MATTSAASASSASFKLPKSAYLSWTPKSRKAGGRRAAAGKRRLPSIDRINGDLKGHATTLGMYLAPCLSKETTLQAILSDTAAIKVFFTNLSEAHKTLVLASKKNKQPLKTKVSGPAIEGLKAQLRMLAFATRRLKMHLNPAQRAVLTRVEQVIDPRPITTLKPPTATVPLWVEVAEFIDTSPTRSVPSELDPKGLDARIKEQMRAQRQAASTVSGQDGGKAYVNAGGQVKHIDETQKDHFQAREDIFERLREMVAAMNLDEDFAQEMIAIDNAMHPDPHAKFFCRDSATGVYSGTLYLEDVFHHTPYNLWFLPSIVNTRKGAKPVVNWLLSQDYGPRFFDDLHRKITGASRPSAGIALEDQVEHIMRTLIIDRHVLLRIQKLESTLLQEFDLWAESQFSELLLTDSKLIKSVRRISALNRYIHHSLARTDLDADQREALERISDEINGQAEGLRESYLQYYTAVRRILRGEFISDDPPTGVKEERPLKDIMDMVKEIKQIEHFDNALPHLNKLASKISVEVITKYSVGEAPSQILECIGLHKENESKTVNAFDIMLRTKLLDLHPSYIEAARDIQGDPKMEEIVKFLEKCKNYDMDFRTLEFLIQ